MWDKEYEIAKEKKVWSEKECIVCGKKEKKNLEID